MLTIGDERNLIMSLFDRLKATLGSDTTEPSTLVIVAPVSGQIVSLNDVPDVIFSERIVGDGVAIKPMGNKLVAPANGTINKIMDQNNAFHLITDEGIGVLVNFGVDTEDLKGEGFKRIAEQGQQVAQGDTIIEFDLTLLEQKAKSTLTSVIITEMDRLQGLNVVVVPQSYVAVGEQTILVGTLKD